MPMSAIAIAPMIALAQSKGVDVGLNYVIDGYNAQISTMYTTTKVKGNSSLDKFGVAVQLQF